MIEPARETIGDVSDRAAFEAAHAELGAAATRYATVILGAERRSAVADVMQDAWTRAWAAWPPAEMARRDAWLFRIVRNRCLDEHRRGRRRPRSLDEHDDLAAADDPAASAVAGEALRLLAGLPAPMREALWLRAVDDRSYADIAALQGVPIGTVMSRIHAARSRLSRQLGR